MGKIPQHLRDTIARNIRECRLKKFPGRGGGKKCAEAFGVSPQQWSPWERGMRTPDEARLEQIARFFAVTVEFMRQNHTARLAEALHPREQPSSFPTEVSPLPAPINGDTQRHSPSPPLHEGSPLPSSSSCCPFYRQPQPGQPFSGEVRSLCWLAERFLGDLLTHGLPVRLSRDDIEKLVAALRH